MSPRAVPRPPDFEDRQIAAAELDRNVIVMAGAGTGKTTLLIDRLVLLLLGKEIPVERIVALTFTKKAAEEMRDRLEAKLRSILERPEISPDEKERSDVKALLAERYPLTRSRWADRARKALDDIPKAQIGTIHSFAGHLLRLFPVQAQVDPAFREDDGSQFERIFDEEWEDWLKGELAADSARAPAWRKLLATVELADLKDLARAVAAPDVEHDRLARKGDVCAAARQWRDRLDRLIGDHPISGSAVEFGPRIDALRRVFEHAIAGTASAPVDNEAVDKLDMKPPKDWSAPEVVTELRSLRKRARSLAKVDDATINAALAIVLPLARRLRAELARRGSISFDGLLVFARDLVRDHAEVRAALKAQYDVFLVDEFQDTDPLQGEILFYLAEAPGREDGDWRRLTLGPGRLFVVGDPKQSIYRFRGADIAAFEAFRRRMIEQGAAEAALTANFRSHGHLIDSVNAMFPSLMEEKEFLQPAYQALQCGNPREAESGLEIMAVDVSEAEPKPDAEGCRDFEADLIADWIAANVGKPLHGAPLRYRDVALLFRSTNPFSGYLEALKNRGIPYLAEGEKTFYRRPEVMELFNLLSVVSDPRDALALVGVLRSPVGGLTDTEILELSSAGGLDIRRPPPVHADKIAALYRNLKEVSRTAHLKPVGDVIEEVLGRTWVQELAAGMRHGEQALANVSKIFRLAESWSDQEPLTLRAFVRRLREFREDERDEGENPLADVQYDAVKVMTIHKAKGLEFPVVFLPNLCAASVSRESEPPILLKDWRREAVGLRLPRAGKISSWMLLIEDDVERREAAEEVRVFYVAATRAKERMFFLLRGDAPKNSELGTMIRASGAWPADKVAEHRLGNRTVPVRSEPWKAGGFGTRPSLPPVALGPEWAPSLLAERFQRRAATRDKLSACPILLSPSALLRETPKRRRVFDEDVEAPVTDPILLGLLCHRVLEEWRFQTPERGRTAALKKSLDRAADFLEIDRAEPAGQAVWAEAQEILSGFLASDAGKRLAKVKIVGQEVPFLHPLNATADDGPEVMRGVMDLLYEADGKLVIADYKTNRLEKEGPKKTAERYRVQGDAYREAVRRALGREAEFELIFLRDGTVLRV